MKKKLLALILVLAMLLSWALMLTSCPDDDVDPADDREVDLDEGVEGNGDSSIPSVITDPNDPEASGNEDKYIHDR